MICSIPNSTVYMYSELYLSSQSLYSDAMKIYNMLYNQLKIGICLGWLRNMFTQSKFQNVSAKLKGDGQ